MSIEIFPSTKIWIDKYPPICPYCHHKVIPNEISYEVHNPEDDSPFMEIVFVCIHTECQRYYIAEYSTPESMHFPAKYYKTLTIGNFETVTFPFNVSMISKRFSEIFNQAKQAEVMGLTEVSGMGYRKAIEFLIKDYAIQKHPTLDDKIRKMHLGDVIKTYITLNIRLSEIAKRAVWLGNDEVHYNKKWKDIDISALKRLIELTIHWIEAEEDSKDLIDLMPETEK